MPTPKLTEDELLEALRCVSEYGSITEAARQLNINRRTLGDRVARANEEFAGLGADELKAMVAEGFNLKGYSEYTKTQSGNPIWLKTVRAEQD